MPVVAGTQYTTPAKVWQLGLPADRLFGDTKGLAPGTATAPTVLVQTGTGRVSTVDPLRPQIRGNPHDAGTVRIRCARAGEINRDGVVNGAGTVPWFEVSTDGGSTWDPPVPVSQDNDVAYLRHESTGVLFCFYQVPITTSATFALLDAFSTTTTASPDLTACITAACSMIDQYLIASFGLPLTTWPPALELCASWLTRWTMIERRGLAQAEDMVTYAPAQKLASLGGLSVLGRLEAWQRGEGIDDPAWGTAASARDFTTFQQPRSQPFETRMWRL